MSNPGKGLNWKKGGNGNASQGRRSNAGKCGESLWDLDEPQDNANNAGKSGRSVWDSDGPLDNLGNGLLASGGTGNRNAESPSHPSSFGQRVKDPNTEDRDTEEAPHMKNVAEGGDRRTRTFTSKDEYLGATGKGGQVTMLCYNCNKVGHGSWNCDVQCKRCRGADSHAGKDCPRNTKRNYGNTEKCENCGTLGHRADDCNEPAPLKDRSGTYFGKFRGATEVFIEAPRDEHIVREGTRDRQFPLSRFPRQFPSEPKKPAERKPPSVYIPRQIPAGKLFEECALPPGEHYNACCEGKISCSQLGKPIAGEYAKSFADAGIDPILCKNAALSSYQQLTPVQVATLKKIMSGDDIMACAQTGTGKTAAYLLPIMTKLIAGVTQNDKKLETERAVPYPKCVVLVPTRELAEQVSVEARKFALGTNCKVVVLYGGTLVSHQKRAFSEGADVLVATIGRFLHFLTDSVFSMAKVMHLVLDEADRMLDLGFLDEVETILKDDYLPTASQGRQTIMFSATFPSKIQELASEHLRKEYIMVAINEIGSTNPFITQTFEEVSFSQKSDKLFSLLNLDMKNYTVKEDSKIYNQKTLVFVRSKIVCDSVATLLCSMKLPATSIHGDRTQAQREEALHAFRHGQTPILIATDVAARGLDIPGVDHVINYDLPPSREDYVHRIGRTGRIGNSGRATSFFDPEKDGNIASGLVDVLKEVNQKVPDFLLKAAGILGSGGFVGYKPVITPTSDMVDDGWSN